MNKQGVSIRTLSYALFLAALLAVVFSLFESQRTITHTQTLYDLEQERKRCDLAIQQFMDGSDYLTGQIQQFVVQVEREYMDQYWAEVYETRSRDIAIDGILREDITPQEREAATHSKAESDELIQGEIWAMRMVCESMGMAQTDMPKDVADFELAAEDAALSPAAKRDAALRYIFGPEYSINKDVIRGNVNYFRNEISNRYAEEALAALGETHRISIYITSALLLFLVLLIGAILCYLTQVVSPLLRFANDLARRDGERFVKQEERGALEIRQLIRAFNALSEYTKKNTERLERMGYIDFLTEVPNRAGITEYVSGLIAENRAPIGLMIVDIDNFKKYNDTYGHAIGDRVLRRVAQAVCSVQGSERGISGRLCGEEFVVAAQGANKDSLAQTAESILHNVRSITGADVDMPQETDFHITVSAGGMLWYGGAQVDFETLLSKADKALYEAKRGGKNAYRLYSGGDSARQYAEAAK